MVAEASYYYYYHLWFCRLCNLLLGFGMLFVCLLYSLRSAKRRKLNVSGARLGPSLLFMDFLLSACVAVLAACTASLALVLLGSEKTAFVSLPVNCLVVDLAKTLYCWGRLNTKDYFALGRESAIGIACGIQFPALAFYGGAFRPITLASAAVDCPRDIRTGVTAFCLLAYSWKSCLVTLEALHNYSETLCSRGALFLTFAALASLHLVIAAAAPLWALVF